MRKNRVLNSFQNDSIVVYESEFRFSSGACAWSAFFLFNYFCIFYARWLVHPRVIGAFGFGVACVTESAPCTYPSPPFSTCPPKKAQPLPNFKPKKFPEVSCREKKFEIAVSPGETTFGSSSREIYVKRVIDDKDDIFLIVILPGLLFLVIRFTAGVINQ